MNDAWSFQFLSTCQGRIVSRCRQMLSTAEPFQLRSSQWRRVELRQPFYHGPDSAKVEPLHLLDSNLLQSGFYESKKSFQIISLGWRFSFELVKYLVDFPFFSVCWWRWKDYPNYSAELDGACSVDDISHFLHKSAWILGFFNMITSSSAYDWVRA